MRLSIYDIAKKAGVSKSTVSRVLNNRADVEENTRATVLKVIEENRWSPNPVAVGYIKKKTHLIGLLTLPIGHPWQVEVFKGVQEGLKDYNYNLLVLTYYMEGKADTGKELDQFFNNGLADGLIVLLPSFIQDYTEQLAHSPSPFVVIDDTGYAKDKGFSSVGTKNYNGAKRATSHLLELGHRQIAFIGSSPSLAYDKERLRGYKAALRLKGVDFNPALVKHVGELTIGSNGDFFEKGGYEHTKALLEADKGNPSFTAVFGATDEIAYGAMRAIQERGLKVPDDFSVVGFDDLPRSTYNLPPLTTIHQPMHEIGQTAVKLLMKQIDSKENNPEKIELDTKLIIRESTRAL